MKKNKLTWMLAALLGLFVTACSNDETVPGTEGNDSKVITFTVNPDYGVQTRATNPTIPTGKVLRYIMEVYDTNTGDLVAESRQVKTTADASAPIEFGLEKKQGTAYTVVFWADYTATANVKDDLYYDTTTGGLKAVTFKQTTTVTDFDGEAFYGSTTISAEGNPASTAITLKHSVAQVNIKTTTKLTDKQSVSVNYGETLDANAPNATFNAIDGEVTVPKTIAKVVNKVDNTQIPTPEAPYTFHTFYTFAPKSAQGIINMRIAMCSDNAGATTTMLADVPNVPLQANYRTNIIGDFGKDMHIFSISCDATWETGDNDMDLNNPVDPNAWDGVIPDADPTSTFGGGTGTQPDPYIIATPAHLALLGANVKAGTSYQDKYFRLDKDINLGNHEWTPIDGTNGAMFSASFDGAFHTISNLQINTSSNSYAGLFGRTQRSDYQEFTIENLHVSGSVNSTMNHPDSYAAGIIARPYVGTQIKNCSFSGTVLCEYGYAGGIAGMTVTTSLYGCKNTGNITGKYAGGIAGQLTQGQLYIDNCYNTGTVHGTAEAGGICAYAEQGDMRYCYNIGTVTCDVTEKTAALSVRNSAIDITACYYKTVYAVVNANEVAFSGESGGWPTWKAAADADGTEEKGYWKSLGSWNDSNPTYPTLWWE